ncbi:MAG: helix-hairpin-helix domain-containing protein [Hyphomicrobiaceae bacterium]|nr:helix-hairpin-helix domain-containing protein [Hyphomicrobiaceae bacterium]
MGKLDINTATLEEIERIHGIGHGRARQIVEYRQRHGGIRRLEELLELPLFRSASPEDRQALTDSFLVTAATLPVSVAGKLDLNRANRGDLEQIRGIGERRIETLLDYRRRHRGFRSLDELDALPGFEDMDPIEREAIKAHLTLE